MTTKMKTILVLSANPEFAEAVRTSVLAEQYRVLHPGGVDEAEPLLVHALANACILDGDLTGVETIWAVKRIRRFNKTIPIIAYTAAKQAGWEEEAFLQGVNHVLAKPVRERLLLTMLENLWKVPAQQPAATPVPPGNTAVFARAISDPNAAARFVGNVQALDVLRDFSSILTHSLDAGAMLRQFLQFLRETMSINRAAIFLILPSRSIVEPASSDDQRRLKSVAAIGLNRNLLEHFELSLDAGIGAQVMRLGRILRRESEEARADFEVQKEFELLGAQIAVPVPDREKIIGVAILDGRITGEPLVNVELEMIFHLLEQVGLALRNIWLHDQLSGNHEMMTGVLRELSNACIVVGRDLKVLHANKAAQKYFGRKDDRSLPLDFGDLPPTLGTKVYQVLKTGAALGPFRFEPENAPGRIFKIGILPFQHGSTSVPASALLTAEDLTESEQLKSLEAEAVKLRLLNRMSDRLAQEAGTAITPIDAAWQLLFEKLENTNFRDELDAMSVGIKKLKRISKQMLILGREGHLKVESFPVSKLLEEAFQEAAKYQGVRKPQLKFNDADLTVTVNGDREALKQALFEVMLNALQANAQSPKVAVSVRPAIHEEEQLVAIEVQDNGGGFTAEAARRVPAPFDTARASGLGLGLTVSQKIIESHHGRLEIVPANSGVVRIILPVESASD